MLSFIQKSCILIRSNSGISTNMDETEGERKAVKLDEFILLIDNRKQQRLLKPSQNKNFKWRKMNVKLQQLSRFQYFQVIEVGNNQLSRSQEQFQHQSELDEAEEIEQVLNANNKEIYTLQSAQKLQSEDINQLKASKNASQIIEAIVNNNQQFDKRTAYSKKKYLDKKQKKYLFRFHAEWPTLENVHNFYFQTDPKSIGFVRWDMFAFILLQGSPYNNVLLAEKTKGLFLAALIQRSAKSVSVYGEETKTIKRFPIVQQLNIGKQKVEKVVRFDQWKSLIGKIERNEVKQKFTNLILVGNYNFEQIVEKIEPALASGCIICFHCQNLEPLQNILSYMKSKECYIHLKLLDIWARQYQVLKNRTHPNMYMSSQSGYILTAIKVQ